MLRRLGYAVLPLLWLWLLAALAALAGYGLLQLSGDILPLAKIVSKATLIFLLLSVLPLRKYFGLSWSELGFAPYRPFFRQFGQGLLWAVVTLLPVLLLLYALEVHVWDPAPHWTLSKIAGKVGIALLLSCLIGIGEELLFRGLLLAALRRVMPVLAAAALSAVYYAALHFLKSKSQIPYAELTPLSGFRLMAEAFGNWLNPTIFGAWAALAVVGLFLALVRIRVPQSLGLCIGLHTGWVWQIKVSKDLLNVNPHSEYLYLVTGYDGVVGPLIGVWLAIMLAIYAAATAKARIGQ